jgi:hypothetical protein
MKKCPPGVMCVENITLVLFFLFGSIFLFFIFKHNTPSETIIVQENGREREQENNILSWPYFNSPLTNPFAPPLRDERYLVPATVPINISTNIGAVDTNYRQVGILAPSNGNSKDNIMPLMGRPLFTNRDKWQYFCTSNQHNNVKLPISKAGKSCTNEYGCDKLYTGDTVFVEGSNEVYRVTVYDNDTIKYLPFV